MRDVKKLLKHDVAVAISTDNYLTNSVAFEMFIIEFQTNIVKKECQNIVVIPIVKPIAGTRITKVTNTRIYKSRLKWPIETKFVDHYYIDYRVDSRDDEIDRWFIKYWPRRACISKLFTGVFAKKSQIRRLTTSN